MLYIATGLAGAPDQSSITPPCQDTDLRVSPGVRYESSVLYRMRIYRAVPENLETFHEFFRNYLLPVQLRHGARLTGRWRTDDPKKCSSTVTV